MYGDGGTAASEGLCKGNVDRLPHLLAMGWGLGLMHLLAMHDR